MSEKTTVEEFLEACVWVSGISMDDGRWSELLKAEKLKYYLQNTSAQWDAWFDHKKTAKAIGNRKLGIPPTDYVLEATGYEYGANALICIRIHHPDYVKIFDTSVKKSLR